MLAHFLMKRNRKVYVVDDLHAGSSSGAGAGIMNPVTGQRLVKTWKADQLFPFAENVYTGFEKLLGTQIFHPLKILRLFASEDERKEWEKKSRMAEYVDYLSPEMISCRKDCLKSSEGFYIQRGGYVDMPSLIGKFRDKILKDRFIAAEFNYNDLPFLGDEIRWKGILAKKVIFCEGYRSALNPYFKWLPFVPAKGEVLVIHSENLKVNEIINKGIFILPLGNDLYKVGSTYAWNPVDELPTWEGKEQICSALEEIISCEYSIISHLAGIRPTVKDRKPFLGLHPQYPNLGIFNGLGTKGASLAPYFADHFAEFLEEGTKLDEDVDIVRLLDN